MFDNSYQQTLQDQIGQLSKLLGGQAVAAAPGDGAKSADRAPTAIETSPRYTFIHSS